MSPGKTVFLYKLCFVLKERTKFTMHLIPTTLRSHRDIEGELEFLHFSPSALRTAAHMPSGQAVHF